MTFEIGVAEKESSANLPFVEIGRRGNVRADGDLSKRRIYDLSELFCAPQVGYRGMNLHVRPRVKSKPFFSFLDGAQLFLVTDVTNHVPCLTTP